jgi:hypothetical protein
MKKLMTRSLFAAIAATTLMLTGCDSDAFEGKYTVTKQLVGNDAEFIAAELSKHFIIFDDKKIEVKEWIRLGESLKALGKDGNVVLSAKVIDDGKTMIATECNSMVILTLKQI